MTDGPYSTTHEVNITFNVPGFSSRKIITNFLCFDHAGRYSGIVYEIIMGHELMVQLGPKENFGWKFLEWDETDITMKDPRNFLGKTSLT